MALRSKPSRPQPMASGSKAALAGPKGVHSNRPALAAPARFYHWGLQVRSELQAFMLEAEKDLHDYLILRVQGGKLFLRLVYLRGPELLILIELHCRRMIGHGYIRGNGAIPRPLLEDWVHGRKLL